MKGPDRIARARELFEFALTVAPETRRSALEARCGDAPDLVDEVLELCDIDARSNAAEPAGVGREWLAERICEAEPGVDAIPSRIGHFRVLRILGCGSMGSVYLAEQQEPARRVAIKVLHGGVAGPSMLRRFQREIHAMGALHHPGIAALYEANAAAMPDGTVHPYIVMEYIEGPTLRDYVGQTRMDPRGCLQILAMVCDAVHHAHQRGVVHRDLKPDNILVHSPGLGPQPKILDFGVSRLIESEDGGIGRTLAGEIVGTVPYLSPEQARGLPGLSDTRSDVYSLGVIAFELVCGRLPFDIKGRGTAEGIRTILESSPLRVREVAPHLDPDIQVIIHRAMHADPALRYTSAAELAADIRRYLDHLPILARPPRLAYIARRFVQRHRALTAVVAIALTLLAAAGVTVVSLWAQASRERAAAEWRSYRSAMSAASNALATGNIAIARRELESTPIRHRGWEHDHFRARLDQSLTQLTNEWSFGPASIARILPGSVCLVSREGVGSVSLATGRPDAVQPDPRLHLWYAALCARFPGPIAVTSPDFLFRPQLNAPPVPVRLALPDWPFSNVLDAKMRNGRIAILIASDTRHEVVLADPLKGTSWRLGLDPEDRVRCLAMDEDGSVLVLGMMSTRADSPCIRVFQLNESGVSSSAQSPPLPRIPFSTALSAGGDRAYVMLQSGGVDVWDCKGPTLLHRNTYNHDAAEGLSLSACGSLLVAGSRDGLVRIFDARDGSLVREFHGHGSEIIDTRFSSDTRHILSTGRDGSIRIWSVDPRPAEPLVIAAHTHLVHGVVRAHSRDQIITGGWDGVISISDATTGQLLATTRLKAEVLDLALSPDERILAARELGNFACHLFDAQTLTPLPAPPPVDINPDEILFDSRSERITWAFDADRMAIPVYTIATGAMEVLPAAALDEFQGSSVAHASGLYADTDMINGRRSIVMYRYRDAGEPALVVPSDRSAYEVLAFTRDGSSFAVAGGDDHSITLYDARTLEPRGAFVGHTREVLAMTFSPDGSRFFSADLTGVIFVWDTRTLDEVAQLHGHANHIRSLRMSPDGRMLTSGSRDGTARIWRAPDPREPDPREPDPREPDPREPEMPARTYVAPD